MSQEAEKVSKLLKNDGKGNNGSEKVTNSVRPMSLIAHP